MAAGVPDEGILDDLSIGATFNVENVEYSRIVEAE